MRTSISWTRGPAAIALPTVGAARRRSADRRAPPGPAWPPSRAPGCARRRAARPPPARAPAQFAVLLATLGGVLLLIRGLRAPGLYGLRRPAGLDWCVLLPFAIFGALAGGVWIPVHATTPVPEWLEALGVLTLPLAAEVL